MENVVKIITVVILGFLTSVIFTRVEIPVLKRKQYGQFIREEGPKSHLSKQGTPTMGGLAIYGAVTVSSLAGAFIFREQIGRVAVIVISGALFGLIGFIDDLIKVTKKHNLGLGVAQKFILQIVFSIILAVYVSRFTDLGTTVWIPFFDRYVDFGVFYVPFIAFVMVAMTNSVNLNDGLDGLCAGCTAIVSIFFMITAMIFSSGEGTVYLAALAGSCLGFLVFNRYPAKIFMGDTGSMALGAGLTAAVIMTRTELLIPVAGFVFVMESASVIIQVVSFKTRGKRVFRMSPLHHHFEMGGMKETKVVHMFWLITALCSLAAFAIVII